MSDLHTLPLVGHDMDRRPEVRATVFSTSPHHWWWAYQHAIAHRRPANVIRHGPFASQEEAYDSAHRMVTLL